MTRRGKWIRVIVAAEVLALLALLGVFAWWRSLDGVIWRLSHVPHWRYYTLKEVVRFGPAAPDAIPAILEALDDPQPAVQYLAAKTLNQVGGTPALLVALRHPNPTLRWRAAERLAEATPELDLAVPALRAALKDPWFMVREAAAQALGNLGPSAAEAVPDLAAALRDSDARVRSRVVVALGQIGVMALVEQSLTDTEREVRLATVRTLGKMGPAAVPMLTRALVDADGQVAYVAADSLGGLGPAAAPAIPELVKALRAEHPLRRHAEEALIRIGPEGGAALQRARGDGAIFDGARSDGGPTGLLDARIMPHAQELAPKRKARPPS